jgi:hypothetical protein
MEDLHFLLGALLMPAATPGSFGAPGCLSIPANLVGWWPADGIADDIAGTAKGTLPGGATAVASGIVGTAFSSDGANSYVQIPDSAALRPTVEYSSDLEHWFKAGRVTLVGNQAVFTESMTGPHRFCRARRLP